MSHLFQLGETCVSPFSIPGSNTEGQMVWTRGESERNSANTIVLGKVEGGDITRKTSKTVVGRCKGMYTAD